MRKARALRLRLSEQSPPTGRKTRNENLVLTILAKEESEQAFLKGQRNAIAGLVGLNTVDILPLTHDNVDTYVVDRSSFEILNLHLLIVIKPPVPAGDASIDKSFQELKMLRAKVAKSRRNVRHDPTDTGSHES